MRISHNKINRVGQKRDRLAVISEAGSDKFGCALWLCKCECGNQVVSNFRTAKSCGCLRKELLAAGQPTHKMSHVKEYKSWTGMRERCSNIKNKKYPRYGARGIKVCERWLSFENFISDMGFRPSGTTSIERINNDGNYEPENCRWASNLEQSRNKSTNVFLEYNGERLCLLDWAIKIGIKWQTLQKRLKKGWTIERALTEEIHMEKRSFASSISAKSS